MRPLIEFKLSLLAGCVLSLCFLTGAAAQPTVTVRFAHPDYTCASGQYCVDVEFQADEPDLELFGMNVRFFYDVELLTFSSFGDFQGGYGPAQPNPPLVSPSQPGIGYNWFGFGSPGTGVAAYVNGAIQLIETNLPEIVIPTSDWTKLFEICFTIGATNVDSLNFCPPLVWDLEVDPADGGWLPGSQGVVITVVNPAGGSEPVFENVNQFNWAYSGDGTPPYGAPVEASCIDLYCIPAVSCPADMTVDCNASTDPAETGTATASEVCGATNTVIYQDVITTPPGGCPGSYLIERKWIATNSCDIADTCTQWIAVADLTPPSVTCPADATVSCTTDTSPAALGSATATDNCDTDPLLSHADVLLDPPGDPGYVIQRTWTAVDECGNTGTCVQVITVTNPLVPEVTGLAADTICSEESVSLEAEDPGIPGVMFEWSFGSGSTPGSAMDAGPHVVTYGHTAENGTTGAWVLLTLSLAGCEPVTDTVANILVNPVPDAAFTATPTPTCLFQPTVLGATAPEVPGYTYTWNFGSGAVPGTAATYGPHTIEYGTTGAKTVELIVQANAAGASCSNMSTAALTVNTCPGNISGHVTYDGGNPLQGVRVDLFADNDLDGLPDGPTPLETAYTTASGSYLMILVTPGHYVLQETQPSGYFSVEDVDLSNDMDSVPNLVPDDDLIPVTIEHGELDAHNNFIEASAPGIISGYVFDDADSNEAPGSEEGIEGVVVGLYDDTDQDGQPDSGVPVATATTSATGYYVFSNVDIGDYVLIAPQPAGYDNIKDIDISNDGDAVTNTDMTDDIIPVSLDVAENDAGNYFIERLTCSRVVVETFDGGIGTLRYIIDCAESGDTISFHPSLENETIEITLDRITFDKTLYIQSDISPTLVIRSQVNGAFEVLGGHTVQFKNLVIISGMEGFPGAAFENLGDLILEDVTVRPNPLLAPGEQLIFNGGSGMLIIRNTTQVLED